MGVYSKIARGTHRLADRVQKLANSRVSRLSKKNRKLAEAILEAQKSGVGVKGIPTPLSVRAGRAISNHPVLSVTGGAMVIGAASNVAGDKYKGYRDPAYKKVRANSKAAHRKRKFAIRERKYATRGTVRDEGRIVRADKKAASYMILQNEQAMADHWYQSRKRKRKGKTLSPQKMKNLRASLAYLKNENRGALERINKY